MTDWWTPCEPKASGEGAESEATETAWLGASVRGGAQGFMSAGAAQPEPPQSTVASADKTS